MLMSKSNRNFFSNQEDVNSKISDPIWTVLELIQDFSHVPLICKFQEALIKTKQVMLMTKPKSGVFSSQGKVTKINDLIWPVFKIRVFIHVHLMSEFQEDLNKTE